MVSFRQDLAEPKPGTEHPQLQVVAAGGWKSTAVVLGLHVRGHRHCHPHGPVIRCSGLVSILFSTE